MSNELNMAELDGELCAELPDRNMMRHHRRRRHHAVGARSSAFASFGSAANSNSTSQINFNPQIVINNGRVGGSGISVSSHNSNFNTTNQTAVPINFGF
jgi:hypothetical protein